MATMSVLLCSWRLSKHSEEIHAPLQMIVSQKVITFDCHTSSLVSNPRRTYLAVALSVLSSHTDCSSSCLGTLIVSDKPRC
ncbi:hypothetical protein D3C85_1279350 [compost metagenome]